MSKHTDKSVGLDVSGLIEEKRRGRVDGRPDNEKVAIEHESFERGFALARRSGRVTPDQDDVAAVSTLAAESSAREPAAMFDPATDPADRLMADEADRDARTRRDLEPTIQHAKASVRDFELERAALGHAMEAPVAPVLAGCLGALGVATTSLPTIYASFVAQVVPNQVQGLTIAGVLAALLGGTVSWLMLRGAETAIPPHTIDRVLGLLVPLLLPVGMIVLRWHSPFVAIGFGLVELALVLALEHVRSRVASHARVAAATNAVIAAADERVIAARRHRDERVAEAAALDARRQAFIEMVRARSHHVRSASTLAAAGTAAARAGYMAGIAETRGHVNGSAVKPPSFRDATMSVTGASNSKEDVS